MDATSSDHRSQSSSQPTFRSSVINKAVKVERFEVRGLQRTKESIVWRELPETLVGANVSLKDLVQALQDSHDRLSSLGIFDGIDIAINAGAQSQDGCTIAVRLQESSMFGFRAGTYVQGHEATMESSLNLNNSMGRAEQAAFTLEYGSQRTNLWSATVTLPRPQGLNCIADVRLHQTFNDKSQWSSYTERLRGIIATVATEDGRHALSYELGWQRLADPSQCASASVARQLGDHVKSAVKYTFRTDTFDDFLFPRHGWGVRASTELAGLGPDARLLRYLRHQVAGRMAFPVNSAATLHLEGLAGILVPWGASNIVKTSITDRFFLGGIAPEGLRGFRYKSVGPRDVRRPQRSQGHQDNDSASRWDSIGGDISVALLAALRFSFPSERLNAMGVKGQFFFNCGNVAQLQPRRSWQDIGIDLQTSMRSSVGCGLLWPLAFGNLEVNWTRALRQCRDDRTIGGFQFGFTTSL